MFSWGKRDNKAREVPKADLENLKYYHSVLLGVDGGDKFEEGDFVRLKDHPCLPGKHGGCVRDPEGSTLEKIYAYVLKRTVIDRSEDKCVSLGDCNDLVVAVPYGEQSDLINIVTCDSRLFRKAEEHEVCSKLREFVADTPIKAAEVGTLVRPRAHIEISHGSLKGKLSSFSSSYSTEQFLTPLMVIGSYETSVRTMVVGSVGKKVIITGGDSSCPVQEVVLLGQTKEGKVRKVIVYANLLCPAN